MPKHPMGRPLKKRPGSPPGIKKAREKTAGTPARVPSSPGKRRR